MRLKFLAVLLLALLVLPMTGYCANYNNWGNTDLNLLLGRQLPYDLIHLGQERGGVSTQTTGTTAIPLSYSLVKMVCSTKTNTLANGVAGQIITLVAVDQTGTLTITPSTSTGWASASMGTNGHSLTLLFIDSTRGWIVVNASGTTLTYKNSGS